MSKYKNGFTLTEVVVSVGILSLVLLTVFRLLGSSNQRLSYSSDLFAAIHLGTKVRADLGEEVRLNPAFLEMLHEYPELTDQGEVVDGGSWYFRWGIDRKPPLGTIDSRDGPTVTPADGALYSELKPFRIKLEAQRQEPPSAGLPESHLCETVIRINWGDKAGKLHDYHLAAQVFSPSAGVIPEGLFIDQDTLLKLIRKNLFPADEGLTLDQAAAANECDRELAYHAGRIAVLMSQLDQAIGTITAEITELGKQRRTLLATPDGRLIPLQMRIAARTEDGASLLYNVLAECRDSWDHVARETDPNRLGKLPVGSYRQGLKTYATLGPQIADWVKEAGDAYEWLLQAGMERFITDREREIAAGKRLEAYRLLLKLRPGAATSFASFLKREGDRVAGKNPHLMKFFQREELLRQRPERYVEVFPNLKDILQRMTLEILPNGKKVPELIARHPQGGQP
ncbi:MAG TPA: prepilin-type N-terminal cleavage/methylation domain-containing protein [Candidatus Ozemobacteraceae bacterium]|nr:prepilin-type N-terminal cleavage/methylation domain-containing protein [Candidatus Ozemobacteraceae bacterium]